MRRRRLTLMALLLGASCQSALGRPPATQYATEPAKTLIDLWQGANELCRGGAGDDPMTLAACSERERYATRLDRLDWCYGKRGQYGAQMSWHRCGPTSLRPSD